MTLITVLKTALILRGIPGAGKSTLASQRALACGLAMEDCVFNTDRLFDELNHGVFAPALLSHFHQVNLTRFIQAAARSVPLIVCDNTNTVHWEYMAYEAAARALGYRVEVCVVGDPGDPAQVEQCVTRNVRGVPADKVREMAQRLVLSLAQEKATCCSPAQQKSPEQQGSPLQQANAA